MRLGVHHHTSYRFDRAPLYGLQRLRLSPIPGPTQTVVDWDIEYGGCVPQLAYVDYLGNNVTLARTEDGAEEVVIEASGLIETHRPDGVIGPHRGALPLWYFLRSTGLTKPGPSITKLVKQVKTLDSELHRLHELSLTIRSEVDFEPGETETSTTAEEAMVAGRGVCQDHTHIFVAAVRAMNIPARYVSGYLLLDDGPEQSAGHAWAEAHVDALGWVGFDVANGICADERYVRVAVGLDYHEAAPVAGVRFGDGDEHMAVALQVAQQ